MCINFPMTVPQKAWKGEERSKVVPEDEFTEVAGPITAYSVAACADLVYVRNQLMRPLGRR